MKHSKFSLSSLFTISFVAPVFIMASLFSNAAYACNDMIDYEAQKLRSKDTVNFCDKFDGKPLLVVNTASKCGFTKQFEQLEELNQRYKGKLNIVGFPSNDFKQEHADTSEISDVCFINYGVTFTMLEPSSVKGEQANALFKRLSNATGEEPGWNFTKYLISADGQNVAHFESSVKPTSELIVNQIESLIQRDALTEL